jgi:protein phosphatase-4 regulatory subunit 3
VINLPPAELAALPQIVKTIGEALPFNRERIATLIARDQMYIRKLMEIFRICEERGNTEGLRMMFKVVKGLISLNDGHIFDMIFSDEYLMDIVGALEYDSELSTHQHHRKYLREQVIFKEVKQTGNMLLPISTMCFYCWKVCPTFRILKGLT